MTGAHTGGVTRPCLMVTPAIEIAGWRHETRSSGLLEISG
jgi:hypothetical protein